MIVIGSAATRVKEFEMSRREMIEIHPMFPRELASMLHMRYDIELSRMQFDGW